MVKKKVSSRKENGQLRPPVVVVLGHVDHGKTTLLDSIRKTNIAADEAGGITQRIGAYQIEHKGQKITFLDTPGHVAFSEMRSRGSRVADLAILVIAADEGVKPQTKESLKHLQSAAVPFLVALNKIDLPEVNLLKAKEALVKNGLEIEGYGGQTVVVPVSGKTGQGIEDLLEMIVILAQMAELKGSPHAPFEGVVVESSLDSRRGLVATVLVRNGSLKIGENLSIEGETIKIRAMFDESGKKVLRAGPSMPVEILGFKKLPPVGSRVEKAGMRIETQESKQDSPADQEKEKKIETEEASEKKRLKIILKTDMAGVLEAIMASFPDEVQIIHSGIGNVSESDVLLAETTGSRIIAFNVKVPASVKKLAEVEGIKIAVFKIIYRLLEEVEKEILKMMEPTINEEILGRAEIQEEFEIRKERIAGCRMLEGKIQKNDRLHLIRKKTIIGDCRVKSLKVKKTDVPMVEKGQEFGIIITPTLDFGLGDMLVSFRKIEAP